MCIGYTYSYFCGTYRDLANFSVFSNVVGTENDAFKEDEEVKMSKKNTIKLLVSTNKVLEF